MFLFSGFSSRSLSSLLMPAHISVDEHYVANISADMVSALHPAKLTVTYESIRHWVTDYWMFMILV